MVFIRRMKAKNQRGQAKSGVHQVNESRGSEGAGEKWCSSGE
ncbi:MULTISPECIES: hypothetical protein [Bacillaceae]|nr:MULTISPECIES: hypothetical protein [Bacillaceae]MED3793291.1 hypothetical protein [Niallia alba]